MFINSQLSHHFFILTLSYWQIINADTGYIGKSQYMNVAVLKKQQGSTEITCNSTHKNLPESHCESTGSILPKMMLLERVPLNNQWINNKKAASLFTRIYQSGCVRIFDLADFCDKSPSWYNPPGDLRLLAVLNWGSFMCSENVLTTHY